MNEGGELVKSVIIETIVFVAVRMTDFSKPNNFKNNTKD